MDEKLVIDLDKLDSDEPLKENSYIYEDLLDLLYKRVRETAKANREYAKERGRGSRAGFGIRQHPCFFINGGRGTGKSTLLRGIREKLIDSSSRFDSDISFSLLAEVDPTELAEGESFMIHMLSHIWEQMDKANFRHESDSGVTDAARRATKCLRDMSKGLQMLSGAKEALNRASDASFFIEECVEQCSSGTELKHKFCELLENLSIMMGCDTFLVTVDDADMNFSKCAEVLERVRQYMLSPRIIFIFAGDIKLYSLVVRGMQLRHFGERELNHDAARADHRKDLLNNLEDQYLMKLFPAGNRITLINAQGLLQRMGETTLKTEKGGSHTAETALNKYLSHIAEGDHRLLVTSLLSSMPVRSVLQLLRYWMNNVPLPAKEENEGMTPEALKELCNGLRHICTQALVQHQIDSISIHEGDIHALHHGIIEHIAHMGTDAECPKILPNIGTTDDKLVSLYLGTEAARLLDSPAKLLEYIYTVFPQQQYALDEMQTALADAKNGGKDSELLFSETLREQLSYTNHIEYRQWGARCTGYMAARAKSGDNMAKRYARGTIRLMKQSQVQKKPDKKGALQARLSAKQGIAEMRDLILSSGEERTNMQHELLPALIAFYHAISTIRSVEGFSYYLSVYNLLSLMIELLETLRGLKEESGRREAIRRILTPNDLGFPGYSAKIASPDKATKNKATMEDETDDEADDEEDKPDAKSNKRYDVHATFSKFINEQIGGASDVSEAMSELMARIDTWAQANTSSGKLVFPAKMNAVWNHFYTRCNTITDNARLITKYEDALVKAGNLFGNYMDALVDSVNSGLPTETATALTTFPLWQALGFLQEEEQATPTTPQQKLQAIINKLNIGPVKLGKSTTK